MFILKFPFILVNKSFLFNRSLFVAFNDEKFNIFNIVAGVPLGNVLNPALYDIYTSDLKILSSNCFYTSVLQIFSEIFAGPANIWQINMIAKIF